MKKHSLLAILLCVCLLSPGIDIFAQKTEERSSSGSDDIARAKIGIRIRSNESIRRAKSADRVKPGDELRIYIQPELKNAMIYVLYHDRQQLVPLYEGSGKSPVILPSKEANYTVDGQSPTEELTIVYSPEPLDELEEFLRTQTQEAGQDPEAWEELEESLLERSQFDLSEDISKPWSIAGAVRSVDPFLVELPTFSGKTFIIKKYEFLVEK